MGLPEPPPPPEAARRVRLYAFQWVGLAVLVLIPALAIAGVFGERWSAARASAGGLDARVTWPTRFRYKQLNAIELRVRNIGSARLDTVTVSLDSSYALRFSTVRAVPAFADAFALHLVNVAPGEERLAMIEIQAERYGRHTGALRISAAGRSAGGGDSLAIPLSTIVFP